MEKVQNIFYSSEQLNINENIAYKGTINDTNIAELETKIR